MLDIRLIREQADAVKERLTNRGGSSAEQIDAVLRCDVQRRQAETRLQQLQADRNRISKEIGFKKKAGEDTSAIETEVRAMGEEIKRLNEEAAALDQEQRELLLGIPNLPHPQCPVGTDASANPEVKVWGTKPEFVKLQTSHAAFHKTAANVAGKINARAYAEATTMVDSGSAFAEISTEVISHITAMKRQQARRG